MECYNNYEYEKDFEHILNSDVVINQSTKISEVHMLHVYAQILNEYIKLQIEPTEDTLLYAVYTGNDILKTYCMYKHVNVNYKCFKKAISGHNSNKTLIQYFFDDPTTVLGPEHLALACEHNDRYIDTILDAKIIPDYKCAKACISNEKKLQKMYDNGLKIDDDVIELFIKNNVSKKFLVNIDENIIFDVCHKMGINPFNYINGELTDNQKTYKMFYTFEIDEKYFDLDEYFLEQIAEHHMEYDNYVYDLILQNYACEHEHIASMIMNAIADGRYKLNIMSISRIKFSQDRYNVVKKFGHLLDKS